MPGSWEKLQTHMFVTTVKSKKMALNIFTVKFFIESLADWFFANLKLEIFGFCIHIFAP